MKQGRSDSIWYLASFLNSYTADAGMQDEDVYLHRTQLQLGKGKSYRTVLIHVGSYLLLLFQKSESPPFLYLLAVGHPD